MRKLPPDEKRIRANKRWKKWADKNREHVRKYSREFAKKQLQVPEIREKINARRRAKSPQWWKGLTTEQRQECNRRIKVWRQKNIEHARAKARAQYWKHHKKIRAKCKIKTPKEREAYREYYRKWSASTRLKNLNFRIALTLRARIRTALLNGSSRKASSSSNLLGCSISDFKIYIESRFEPGMSWENWGRGADKWHLDHIMPCAIFDLSKSEHQKRCFHFSNYAPLWEPENLSKGAKIPSDQFNLL